MGNTQIQEGSMRHALTTLVVILVVAGFVRGWFVWTSTSKVPESHKVDVNIRVDPDKIKDDAEEIKEKVEQLEEKLTEEPRGNVSRGEKDEERAE
jgi:hypothetical protein